MYQHNNDQWCYKSQSSHWRLMAICKVLNDSSHALYTIENQKFVNRVVPTRTDRISYMCELYNDQCCYKNQSSHKRLMTICKVLNDSCHAL
ncbi:unnamed protein product [Blepharisma stoltei]|uniref:Uncharacterized protein n=1 Tax=Blepharisma stoltei TaxID=1481888 RepID=A0AAU9IKM3_9CILI|nr:unnamed protein product [Blepharisma stoltei]